MASIPAYGMAITEHNAFHNILTAMQDGKNQKFVGLRPVEVVLANQHPSLFSPDNNLQTDFIQRSGRNMNRHQMSKQSLSWI